MGYQEDKARRAIIEARVEAAALPLKAYAKGPMGLTPGHIKQTKEWRDQKGAYDCAFAALRSFNAEFCKVYRKEIREDLDARRQVKLTQHQEA